MPKKLTIHPDIQLAMAGQWSIKLSNERFSEGKSANLPALGYPCAACASKHTKLCLAHSTDEQNSRLEWMELYCSDCNNYTLYTYKI